MKKIFLLIAAVFVMQLLQAAGPSPKVAEAFEKDFGKTSNVNWHEVPDGYTAFFTRGSIHHRVVYNNAGVLVHTLRYYNVEELPSLIRSKLNRRYPDKTIFGVTEDATQDE